MNTVVSRVTRHGLPHTILSMLEQMRWRHLGGAMVCTGMTPNSLSQRYPAGAPTDCEVRGSARPTWDPVAQDLVFDVGVQFYVNGTPGENWQVAVAYEPADEYSVWLIALVDGVRQVIGSRSGIHCDELCEAVIETYDDGIRARNGGFIPLG